jgi:hypothetical protein
VEFIWWGINVFLGSLFGLEAIHHRYLHDCLMHKRLHSGALIVFLTFSSVSLVILLYESLPGTMGSYIDQITGSGLAPVLCTFGVLLQYFEYTILLKKLNQSYHDKPQL